MFMENRISIEKCNSHTNECQLASTREQRTMVCSSAVGASHQLFFHGCPTSNRSHKLLPPAHAEPNMPSWGATSHEVAHLSCMALWQISLIGLRGTSRSVALGTAIWLHIIRERLRELGNDQDSSPPRWLPWALTPLLQRLRASKPAQLFFPNKNTSNYRTSNTLEKNPQGNPNNKKHADRKLATMGIIFSTVSWSH